MKNEKNYFIGLDVGTDSVGYAVVYDDYTLAKYKGEAMWGSTVFEAAKLRDERRGFRSARRRLNRRQQRVELIQELFAKEISKIDEDFFIHIQQSSLFREDKSNPEKYNVYFNDEDYKDADFYRDYPTIHHLIDELMNSDEYHDARFVYIACAWLVAHRGHFLNEVSKENISNILDFEPIYDDFKNYFINNDLLIPWECEINDFAQVLKQNTSITVKEKAFVMLLFNGKKPKDAKDGDYPYNRALILKLLSGGKVKPKDLFFNEQYAEVASLSLGMADEDFASIIAEIESEEEFILKLKAMYDWSILSNVLNGEKSISRAKVNTYEQHKQDLRKLKYFIRKYLPDKYNEVFRESSDKLKNYSAYAVYNKVNNDSKKYIKKASKIEFYDYLKKLLKGVECEEEDSELYEEIMNRIDIGNFLPKQVDGDNRIIPYQLYWYELNTILEKAKSYLPFIAETDQDGISTHRKILSVFEHRVPYFVGPLVSKDTSDFAWMERKAEGKIYPWNFTKMVDFDKSEQAFIKRMTNSCTYLAGEKVLPKNSLLYVKFEILNTINNIKINGQAISVETKQKIFDELVMTNARVSPSKLKTFLKVNGIASENDIISGVDMQISIITSAKAYLDFRAIITNKLLTYEQVERIIEYCAYSEDKLRFKKWIDEEFSHLSEKDRKYIYSMKYKGFGRFSQRLLCGINGVCKETGECGTILDFLWSTNDNFMQLLSDRYTFSDEIAEINKEYYSVNGRSFNQMMDDMYISNSVKRPILRTMDIVGDIVKVMGREPEKIFVEMARGANEDQINKRTKSRKQQILEFYAQVDTEDVRSLSKQLDELGVDGDNKLQSDVLFLYFMQLGRCMYSGQRLDINSLKSSLYNIDHIYPRHFIKDDSVLNNKVLVLSTYNDEKGDKYPINPEWQRNMSSFWNMLHKNKLINDEKYKRLKRTMPFSDEEKCGFINRQLVEVRQSTKAIKNLLENKYSSEIVCVKAGLVSEFRHKFDMLKTRSINDLHHAKDAYLNVVVGNVYNERFTKKWFNVSSNYSMKIEFIFGKPFERGGKVIWEGNKSIGIVEKNMRKNNIHFTRYAFCRKGGLFDQNPLKAAPGLVPIKAGMDTEKYGGYSKTTATYFVLALYTCKNKKELTFIPIELMYSDRFEKDDEFAEQYVKEQVTAIHNKDAEMLSFPLGKRKIKINTVISLDGYKMCLTNKTSGGKAVGLSPITPFVTLYENEKYIKSLERFAEKKKLNARIVVNTEYDGISEEKNIALYQMFMEKFLCKPFFCMPNSQYKTLADGFENFKSLPLETQVLTLLNILLLFKTCRAGTTDLSVIGGSKNAGALTLSTNMSNWKKSYSDVRIIDVSASGLHTKQSENLLELL